MSVLIKYMEIPKGCIYANDKDETEYCPMLNHDDVPFCQYFENEPEAAIGICERPVYCPLEAQPEPCEDAVSRQAAIYIASGYCHPANIAKELEKLPSVQPEIIQCKECKHSEHWYRDKRRCFLWHETGIDVYEDGFCNYAERRTDETD